MKYTRDIDVYRSKTRGMDSLQKLAFIELVDHLYEYGGIREFNGDYEMLSLVLEIENSQILENCFYKLQEINYITIDDGKIICPEIMEECRKIRLRSQSGKIGGKNKNKEKNIKKDLLSSSEVPLNPPSSSLSSQRKCVYLYSDTEKNSCQEKYFHEKNKNEKTLADVYIISHEMREWAKENTDFNDKDLEEIRNDMVEWSLEKNKKRKLWNATFKEFLRRRNNDKKSKGKLYVRYKNKGDDMKNAFENLEYAIHEKYKNKEDQEEIISEGKISCN